MSSSVAVSHATDTAPSSPVAVNDASRTAVKPRNSSAPTSQVPVRPCASMSTGSMSVARLVPLSTAKLPLRSFRFGGFVVGLAKPGYR